MNDIDRVAEAVVASMRARTAKVDFRTYSDGTRISVFMVVPEMSIDELNREVKAFKQKITRAKVKIMAVLFDDSNFYDIDYEILDSFRVGCARGGLMLMGRLNIEHKFSGDQRELQSFMYGLVTDAFKAAGIKASTEVEETEEIEPQGSTPIKERRKSS